ncbi:MAG: methionine synthase [Dehalococcoidia bacterium]|nr:methionine synthase [Dehalococcoidia bacterium]
MSDARFGCLPTMIGSLPYKDADKVCAVVTRYLKDIPCWPQLPKRAYVENMYTQFSQGFPGIVVTEGKTYVNRAQDLTKPLENFYTDYMANDFGKYPITAEYAAGLHRFLALDNLTPRAVKGQVTGPVSWGMTVTDETGKAILYDETFADVVPKFLRLKASWMEQSLRKISRNVIIFLDEPYMSAFGSVGMQLTREQVVSLLDETFSGIKGIKGIHCCGNTDWSVLLQTKVDIINFDAYNYAGSLALYPAEVKRLLDRGGAMAWGIIPTETEAIEKESVASLKDRLEEAMAPFTRKGVPFKQLIGQGLLTPACGLPTVTEQAAERALELLAELSAVIKRKYL